MIDDARSDDQLVAAAREGDPRATDALLRRHYDRIHAVCRRIAGGGRDADDAAQEAMIRIVRNLDRFDGRAAFATWVYRIATNAALDELRRRQRRPQLRIVGDDEQAESQVPDELAHRTVEAIVDRLAIDDALKQLADEFRVPVVLRDVAGLDYAEIAQVLDVPVGTVKSRIARGRKALLERLGNREGPTERPTTERPSADPPTTDDQP